MPNSSFSQEDPELRITIEQNLAAMADQMGHPLEPAIAAQLYQEAVELLGTMAYEPITLARVAGTLLVYQVQKIEAAELEWFKSQVQQAQNAEEVEELMESLYRSDAL